MNGTRELAERAPMVVPNILVIEDEVIIARDIQLRLKSFGYLVPPPLGSGADALKSIAEHAPDLVLMDIRIRGDIDGIETASLIRDRFGTPIVYLTSHSDEATLQRAKATGAYGFVLKPFKDRDLRVAIEVAIQKHQIDRHNFERERWFATTLRAIGDAVIATDSEQRITFMNRVAERVTGWASGDAVGKPLGEVFRLVDSKTGEPLASPRNRALRDGFSAELPPGVGLATRGGAQVSVDNSTVPIVDDHGRTLGGVVVFRDTTAQRRLEERAARNDRLAAIGTLSMGMAHEINNPLTYLLANVSSAVASLERIDERVGALPGAEADRLASEVAAMREALTEAHEGGRRVYQIVHDLKKFGRFDGGEHAIVELTDVLESAIRLTDGLLRHKAHVRREYRTTPFVEANEGQLAQVFVNLLVNAAQAFEGPDPRDNTVTVATFTDDAGRAVAEVRDSGPGVPAGVARRIFDPFFTTKPVGQGTGLGLSIAQSIIRSVGGEISLENPAGGGASFRVSLPPAQKREDAKAASPPLLATRRARVLIIDDEPAIGQALTRALQRDHDVFCIDSAREGLSRIASGEAFDIVFCDLVMTEMDGVAFFEALHVAQPALAARIVFITGGTCTPRAEAFLRATSNVTLSKPVDRAAMRRIIADYLGGD